MDFYFSPLACSMATRIALAEAGGMANMIEIDPANKKVLATGEDYLAVNPLGLVPALRTDDGEVLTENAAILQFIADRFPAAGLAPPASDAIGRARLQQWLCFIGTELHKGLFIPLFDPKAPEGTRAHTLNKYESRLRYLNDHLTGREYLLDRFSVADAYLYAVLNWTTPTRVDLGPWPAIKCYYESLQTRPSIASAFIEEMNLYKAELARHKVAA